MKINTTMEILGLDGKPIQVDDKGKGLTLKTVLTGALVSQPQGETPDGATSVKRLNLALRIEGAATAELSAEETTTLMELVGKMYLPLVAGRVWHILDPTTKEKGKDQTQTKTHE